MWFRDMFRVWWSGTRRKSLSSRWSAELHDTASIRHGDFLALGPNRCHRISPTAGLYLRLPVRKCPSNHGLFSEQRNRFIKTLDIDPVASPSDKGFSTRSTCLPINHGFTPQFVQTLPVHSWKTKKLFSQQKTLKRPVFCQKIQQKLRLFQPQKPTVRRNRAAPRRSSAWTSPWRCCGRGCRWSAPRPNTVRWST